MYPIGMPTYTSSIPSHPLPQVPQLAALYHNDCLHVASELLSLRVAFDVPLRACGGGSMAPSFIEEALRLRENAAAFLQDQADRQSEALLDILSAADGLRKVTETILKSPLWLAAQLFSSRYGLGVVIFVEAEGDYMCHLP